MKRVSIKPRSNLNERVRENGFTFALDDQGGPYWDESAYYSFSLKQIETDLEASTAELAALCLEFVRRAIADEAIFDRLRLPTGLKDLARASWARGDASLYGRFDLCYDGEGPAKLLEFNADTPTGLFEAAVFQWGWLEDGLASGALPNDADQFNSIHDRLVARWRHIALGRVHLAALDDAEDATTVGYLAATVEAAGLPATVLKVPEIGDDGRRFVDLLRRPIDTLFKLYPWEWLIDDPFAKSAAMKATRFVEPAWKAMLSTKAILPLLWEMAPGHPNLLPARFTGDGESADLGGSFARKKLRSREGANVDLYRDHRPFESTGGRYGGASIDQALAPLPDFRGARPVVGSWIVGGVACGIGIREATGGITTNTSRFIPHIIEG